MYSPTFASPMTPAQRQIDAVWLGLFPDAPEPLNPRNRRGPDIPLPPKLVYQTCAENWMIEGTRLHKEFTRDWPHRPPANVAPMDDTPYPTEPY